jgi:mono/diheme cytochrome c family protein
MRNVYLATAFVLVLTVSFLGFRGTPFTRPPIDVFPEWAFPGMKQNRRMHPQEGSAFFADGLADRAAPPHVIAYPYGPVPEYQGADEFLLHGKELPQGGIELTAAKGFPPSLVLDAKFLQRGRERFTIYCAPCHGAVGDGNGVTKRYGMGATPTYHDDRLRQMPEGEIFATITNGKGNMNPYADKLSPTDRWAVIAYVRALQRAQSGSPADVPPEHREELGLE